MKEYVHLSLPDGKTCCVFTAHIVCLTSEGQNCNIRMTSNTNVIVQGTIAHVLGAIYPKT